jgi:hypothetical protein
MTQHKELNELIKKGHQLTEKFKREFSKMKHDQLNFKLNPASWSIGQCIDHLIVSNSTYFTTLEKLTNGNYQMGIWHKLNPLTKMTGKKMIETLGPEVVKKFKSPKSFIPCQSELHENIVNDFEEHQAYFLNQLEQTATLWDKKIVVSSPVSPVITYTVEDLIRILIGHEERHFNQALKVKEHPRFYQ